ncbi:uncharacterized protein LOC144565981 isoform X2 [Carex rostrata]
MSLFLCSLIRTSEVMIRSKKEDPKAPASVELDKFSYIEDAELNKYILSAKERRFKTALWELINRDYVEEKKTKRDQDGNRSNQGQALPNKALEQDAKAKKVKSSGSSNPDIINDAMENCIGEEIQEFTFIDDEE